jgi:amino acid transporter
MDHKPVRVYRYKYLLLFCFFLDSCFTNWFGKEDLFKTLKLRCNATKKLIVEIDFIIIFIVFFCTAIFCIVCLLHVQNKIGEYQFAQCPLTPQTQSPLNTFCNECDAVLWNQIGQHSTSKYFIAVDSTKSESADSIIAQSIVAGVARVAC